MNTIKRHLKCGGCGHVVATSHKDPKNPRKAGQAEDWSMRSDVVLNDDGDYVCPMCDTEVWFVRTLVVPGGDL